MESLVSSSAGCTGEPLMELVAWDPSESWVDRCHERSSTAIQTYRIRSCQSSCNFEFYNCYGLHQHNRCRGRNLAGDLSYFVSRSRRARMSKRHPEHMIGTTPSACSLLSCTLATGFGLCLAAGYTILSLTCFCCDSSLGFYLLSQCCFCSYFDHLLLASVT